MKLNSIVLAAAFALSATSLLTAKTYEIVLNNPTQAGNLTLPAGQYTLDVEGSSAIFRSVDTGKKFSLSVNVEKGETKFPHTLVKADQVNGTGSLKSIELGGSTTRLDFTGAGNAKGGATPKTKSPKPTP